MRKKCEIYQQIGNMYKQKVARKYADNPQFYIFLKVASLGSFIGYGPTSAPTPHP